mmetsp:Transcript_8750/g.22499  ORF Transcript_8750/g.22499 Transcript_8750/m.22499 type:complete len:462 (-) Transcript_8750:106-1491(-)
MVGGHQRRGALLALLALFLVAASGAVRDPKLYNVLGVPPDSPESVIKKAYKKKALMYHPDRAKGDKKQAEKKFQEVAHAYETLSDPEKRKIYDMYGEDGVKNADAGGDPRGGGGGGFGGGGFGGGGGGFGGGGFGGFGGGGGDPFSHFFDAFGGGFGGGGGRQQRQPRQPPRPRVDYSGSQVVALDALRWADAKREKGIWLVEAYTPGCTHCQDLAPEWKKAAESLKGVVKVGAVNCEAEANICAELGASSYPTIKWFMHGKESGKYTGRRKAADLVSWAKGLLPRHLTTSVVNAPGLSSILGRCSGSGKGKAGWSTCVLLFTTKQETAPMFKNLALQYEGDVVFAEVRGREAGELAKDFLPVGPPPDAPFLVALCNGDPKTAELYTGQLKHDPLKRFIIGYRGGKKCSATVKLDASTDFTKLRVAQLKEILRNAGASCSGCVEKDDFVREVKRQVLHQEL